MNRQEFASVLLTATVTACLAAPLTLLSLMLFGADPELRAPVVAAVTASVTSLAVLQRHRDLNA